MFKREREIEREGGRESERERERERKREREHIPGAAVALSRREFGFLRTLTGLAKNTDFSSLMLLSPWTVPGLLSSASSPVDFTLRPSI